jgi:hypothetical protein
VGGESQIDLSLHKYERIVQNRKPSRKPWTDDIQKATKRSFDWRWWASTVPQDAAKMCDTW